MITQRICDMLQKWKEKKGFKLEQVELWTEAQGHKVSRQTVSRALNGQVTRLHSRSAYMLAAFVEMISEGSVCAQSLLEEGNICNRHFENEVIEQKNFTFYRFEKVIFSNVVINNIQFEGALLQNVAFKKTHIEESCFQRNTWINVLFSKCYVFGSDFSFTNMDAVKLIDTKFVNCKFRN